MCVVPALPWPAVCQAADEIFPVVHNDTIVVRVLNGKFGVPLAHARLTLAGGYEARDIGLGLWREELLTDKNGEVRLPNGLANLPFLQILVADHKLCQAHPKAGMFSVERIRRDGLSAPNRCGTFAVEGAPGVFTVFVNGENGAAPLVRGVASAVNTPAAGTAVPTPARVGRQASATSTVPASTPAPAEPSVESGASITPTKPVSSAMLGSRAELKGASGTSDPASPESSASGFAVSGSAASDSAVSSPTVARSAASAAQGPAYRADLALPPFAGINKFYLTRPSTAPTLLLTPMPVVVSAGYRAPNALKAPFPASSPVEPQTGEPAADSTSSFSSARVSSSERARRLSRISSPLPSSAREAVRPASDLDPEKGSPRRSARKAGKAPSLTSPSIRKKAPRPAPVHALPPASIQGPADASAKQPTTKFTPVSSPAPTTKSSAPKAATQPAPAAAPGEASPKQSAANPSASPSKSLPGAVAITPSPAIKAAAPASVADKSPAASPSKQFPGASADQPAAEGARPVRPSGAKPHAGAYVNADAPASKRKPTARPKPAKPASNACQTIPGK